MKFIAKLCASLLVTVITLTVSAYVLNSTLLNAQYLEAKANSTHLYSTLSAALPVTLASGNTPDVVATQQALSKVISSTYVQSKIDPFLTQLDDYYHNKGPAPQLDLTDLVAEAQRQGIVIPANSPLSQPIVFKSPPVVSQAFNWAGLILWAGPLLGLLLLAAVVGLNQGFQRYSAITKVFIMAALTEGVVFLAFKATPSLLDSLVKTKSDTGPFVPALIGFFKNVLTDVSNDFGKAAIILVAVGALVFILGLILKAVGLVGSHEHKTAEPSQRFARPNPENRPPVN